MDLCLFCDYQTKDWSLLISHFMKHMRWPYLCEVCDANVEATNATCDAHKNDNFAAVDPSEMDAIKIWVWNYVERCKTGLIKVKKPLFACRVCKKLQRKGFYRDFDIKHFEFRSDRKPTEHFRTHLKYFKNYCAICKHAGTKTSVSTHVKNIHKDVVDVDSVVFESSAIRKLDQLINSSKEEFNSERKKYFLENPDKLTLNGNGNHLPLKKKSNGLSGEDLILKIRKKTKEQLSKDASEPFFIANGSKPCIKPETQEASPCSSREESVSVINVPEKNVGERDLNCNAIATVTESNDYQSECSMDSYVDPYTTLRPFSIVVERLPDEEFQNCTVLDDFSKIFDDSRLSQGEMTAVHEKSEVEDVKENTTEDNVSDIEMDEIEEIEVPLSEAITEEKNDFGDDHVRRTFICVFCDKVLKPFEDACNHYKQHLDFYPFKCSLCDEVAFTLNLLFNHFREVHKDEKNAVFQRSKDIYVEDWIKTFLTSQVKKQESFAIKRGCPLCDVVHKAVIDLPLYAATSKGISTHIYKHFCYEPFVCTLCLKDDKLVTFHKLADNKTYNHVLKHHNEFSSADLATIIHKKRKIVPLEKFITQYLSLKDIRFEEKTSVHITNFMISKFNEQMKAREERLRIKKEIEKSSEKPVIQEIQSENELLKSNLASNPPNFVVSVSPSHAYLNGENPFVSPHFCIFCEDDVRFTSQIDTCSHIAEHLEYFPVVCLLCPNKFSDLKSFVAHHDQFHSNDASNWTEGFFYVVNEDEVIENWIEDFVDFQSSPKSCNLFSSTHYASCPVCKKLVKGFSSSFKELTIHLNLREHIYEHLNYFPYECMVCKQDKKTTRFSFLGKKTSDHLLSHGINEFCSELFVNTMAIKNLEIFISKLLVNQRPMKRKLEFDGDSLGDGDRNVIINQMLSPKTTVSSTLHSVSEQMTISSSNIAHLSNVITNSNSLFCEPVKQKNEDDLAIQIKSTLADSGQVQLYLVTGQKTLIGISTQDVAIKNEIETKRSQISEAQHSVVDNGSEKQQTIETIDLTNETQDDKANSEDIVSADVYCYHCQVSFKGWLLLKEHHYKVHPSLTLTGYLLDS